MVRIDPPPPKQTTDPVLHLLPPAATLLRIYQPDQYGTTACGFRTDGPFSRFDHHEPGCQRSIHYSAPTLSGCVVEVFGDTGVVETQGCRLALIRSSRPLQLLDRDLSQAWSRHFYTSHAIDGLLYSNAHNSESAIALYDRAEGAISCIRDLALSAPLLRSRLLQICRDHALVMA